MPVPPLCIWTAATGMAERCFIEPEQVTLRHFQAMVHHGVWLINVNLDILQVNKIFDLGGISTKQLRRSKRTKAGAKNTPVVNVVTLSESDRMEDQRASGDRVEDQVNSGDGVEDQVTSGDGVEDQVTSGGGVEDQVTSGGGVEDHVTSGDRVEDHGSSDKREEDCRVM